MKFNVALLLLLLSSVKSDAAVLEENVYILTDKNADQFVANEEIVFVKFYAPWCGHCKKMAPDYKELGQEHNVEGSKIKIAKIDSTVHKEFSTKHKVEGFPTLKLFINGEPIDYSGERTKEAISTFITLKSKIEIKILKTKEEVDEIRTNQFATVFLVPENNERALNQILKFVRSVEFPTAVVYDKTLLPLTISADKALVVFRKFDEGDKVIEF